MASSAPLASAVIRPSDIATRNILEAINNVLTDVEVLQAELTSELAPLLARPQTPTLRQRKNGADGTYEGGFHIKRTEGDLILCRGALVRARLDLKVLLAEADAAPLIVATEHNSSSTFYKHAFTHQVNLTGPQVLAFFSALRERTLLVVPLFLDYGGAANKRTYIIPKHFLPHGTMQDHAQHLLDLHLRNLRRQLGDARDTARSMAVKRKRVEEEEAQWQLAKRARPQ